MRFEFVRSGGFAGLRLALELDTETMPEAEAARLVQLIEEAGLFDWEQQPGGASFARDRFEYNLRIHSGEHGLRTVVLAEPAIPEKMRPLLDHLTALAKRQQQGGEAKLR